MSCWGAASSVGFRLCVVDLLTCRGTQVIGSYAMAVKYVHIASFSRPLTLAMRTPATPKTIFTDKSELSPSATQASHVLHVCHCPGAYPNPPAPPQKKRKSLLCVLLDPHNTTPHTHQAGAPSSSTA